MGQVLLAAIRIQTIIYKRCAAVGVHGTLTNTGAVYSTSATVELVGSELAVELAAGKGIRSVRPCIHSACI